MREILQRMWREAARVCGGSCEDCFIEEHVRDSSTASCSLLGKKEKEKERKKMIIRAAEQHKSVTPSETPNNEREHHGQIANQ